MQTSEVETNVESGLPVGKLAGPHVVAVRAAILDGSHKDSSCSLSWLKVLRSLSWSMADILVVSERQIKAAHMEIMRGKFHTKKRDRKNDRGNV